MKALLAFLTTALILVTAPVMAAEQPYSAATLDRMLAAGQPVVVDFHADWCPVCRKQAPILGSLVQEDKLKNIAAFKVNYDDETALKTQLKVTSQSTLIVFKGEQLVSRAVGVTDKGKIRALIEKGL